MLCSPRWLRGSETLLTPRRKVARVASRALEKRPTEPEQGATSIVIHDDRVLMSLNPGELEQRNREVRHG